MARINAGRDSSWPPDAMSVRADVRSPKTKKARQILTDPSGCLARPNQHHRWFSNYCMMTNTVALQCEKLIIFRAVLQEIIRMDDRGGHIVHRQPFRHRLTPDAFIRLGFAQALTIHQHRLGLLDALHA